VDVASVYTHALIVVTVTLYNMHLHQDIGDLIPGRVRGRV
jgi:hypothetical protein